MQAVSAIATRDLIITVWNNVAVGALMAGAAGALVVAAALLDWAAAPYTGISASTQLAVGATRYLLPCSLAACATIALAGRRPRLVRHTPAMSPITATPARTASAKYMAFRGKAYLEPSMPTPERGCRGSEMMGT